MPSVVSASRRLDAHHPTCPQVNEELFLRKLIVVRFTITILEIENIVFIDELLVKKEDLGFFRDFQCLMNLELIEKSEVNTWEVICSRETGRASSKEISNPVTVVTIMLMLDWSGITEIGSSGPIRGVGSAGLGDSVVAVRVLESSKFSGIVSAIGVSGTKVDNSFGPGIGNSNCSGLKT